MLHSESNREQFKSNGNRFFRHWYDVAKIADDPRGREAQSNMQLLKSVVETKSLLYRTGWSKYQLCLSKQFKLLPDKTGLDALPSLLLVRLFETLSGAYRMDERRIMAYTR
ncbi:MAG: hypothetical protein ACRD3W_14460, partial [Terriglobales bacterium]